MPSLIRSASKILSPRIANTSAAADSVNTSFDMTVRTTSANETFTVPCQNVGTFNATINWGDGSSSTIAAYNDADLVHTYASAGDHSISISGTFPNIYFAYAGDRMKVIAVTNLGEVGWQTFKSAFMGCENMTAFNFGTHTDTSSITDMSGMFRACKRISTLNLSTLNTSSVTNFSYMFSQVMSHSSTYPASLDASGLDTSNGTNFSYMFHFMLYSTSLNVSNLDTSNATNVNSMFDYNIRITSLDVSSFDTSNVTTMQSTFQNLWALTSLDLSNFDTSNVLYMHTMFNGCGALSSLDISSFRTPNVRGLIAMFGGCNVLDTIDVSNFDTSNVTNFERVFDQRYSTNPRTDIIGVENFNFEGITSSSALGDFMRNMSIPTSRYDQLLINIEAQTIPRATPAHFGTSQYTAGGAAEAARANIISTDGWTITDGGALSAPFAMTVRTTSANETFTIPCENYGTFNATVDWGDGSSSTVTTYNDSNLAHTYASAGDHSISISGTFPNIKFGNNSTNAGKVITVTNLGTVGWQSFLNAFKSCGNMTSFNVGVTDTSSVTNMYGMFYGCHLVTTLDLSNFDTSSVTDMGFMFVMISLTTLDVSSFDTSSVTNMHRMFHACRDLTTLDLSNFDTSSVTDMSYMFNENLDLTSLDVSNFNTSSVTTMSNMFYNCKSLTSLDVSSFNTSSVTSMQNMFNRMYNLTSLDLSNFNTSSATTFSDMFFACFSLTSLDVSSFNTSSCTYMGGMFGRCDILTSLDVSNFDTSSVTNMSGMFYNCNITSLDVSGFDTSSVTNMQQMFLACSGLTSLDVSSFNTSSVTTMWGMFLGCNSLTDVVGVENFNIEALNSTSALSIFMGGVTLPTARYDALLVNWDAQDPFDGMSPNFGNSQYTAGGTAAAARANLISTDGWTISDGGTA